MAKPLVRILFGIELLDAVMTEVCPDKSVAEREPKLGENLHYAMFFHEHTLALQRIVSPLFELPRHESQRAPLSLPQNLGIEVCSSENKAPLAGNF